RTRLNMAALAPMPRAMVATTVSVSPLARHKERAPILRSCKKESRVSVMRLPFNGSLRLSFLQVSRPGAVCSTQTAHRHSYTLLASHRWLASLLARRLGSVPHLLRRHGGETVR